MTAENPEDIVITMFRQYYPTFAGKKLATTTNGPTVHVRGWLKDQPNSIILAVGKPKRVFSGYNLTWQHMIVDPDQFQDA